MPRIQVFIRDEVGWYGPYYDEEVAEDALYDLKHYGDSLGFKRPKAKIVFARQQEGEGGWITFEEATKKEYMNQEYGEGIDKQ